MVNLLFLYFLALGLSTKTFTVTAYNRSIGPVGFKAILKIAILFAVIQASMMAIGWLVGMMIAVWLEHYSYVLSYVLILIVGLKIVIGTFKIKGRIKIINTSSNTEVLTLAMATAIDVFIAGLGLGLLEMKVVDIISVLGSLVFLMGIAGGVYGKKYRMKYINLVELGGGLILVVVGVRGLVGSLI